MANAILNFQFDFLNPSLNEFTKKNYSNLCGVSSYQSYHSIVFADLMLVLVCSAYLLMMAFSCVCKNAKGWLSL